MLVQGGVVRSFNTRQTNFHVVTLTLLRGATSTTLRLAGRVWGVGKIWGLRRSPSNFDLTLVCFKVGSRSPRD